jgi:YbbR domain-containing protein
VNRFLEILKHNWPLKLGALLVATVIWLVVSGAVTTVVPLLPEERKVILQVPVNVLVSSEIKREITLKPTVVDVTIKGTPEGVRVAGPADIRVYVDLAAMRDRPRAVLLLQWSVNISGVQIDSVSPRVVEVELR